MPIPEDHARVESIPLEALPAEISSALPAPAPRPETETGGLDIAEPQTAARDDTAINPGALTASQNRSERNADGLILKTKKSELIVIIIGTCIALAALVLQFKANHFGQEANELSRKGNSVAEEAYKLQLWDDCHDRQDLQHSSLCEDTHVGKLWESNSISLIRKDAIVEQLAPIIRELDAMIPDPFRITSRTCSFIDHGACTEDKAKDLWHKFVFGLLKTCLISCHICYLIILHHIIFGQTGIGKRGSRALITNLDLTFTFDSMQLLRGPALVAIYGPWVFAFFIPRIFIAFWSSLHVGLDGDIACAFAFMIPLAILWVVERRIQGLRKDSASDQDEEAQDYQSEKFDLRTLPVISRDTSFAYKQELTFRPRKNLHQQDHRESVL